MKFKYVLYDIFDKKKANPVIIMFDHKLKKKEVFSLNDVSYKVVGRWKKNEKHYARIRMVKYKMSNTVTDMVHRCPAKDMDHVKLRGHMRVKCPHCKVLFWKESMEFPEKVLVDKVISNEDEKDAE